MPCCTWLPCRSACSKVTCVTSASHAEEWRGILSPSSPWYPCLLCKRASRALLPAWSFYRVCVTGLGGGAGGLCAGPAAPRLLPPASEQRRVGENAAKNSKGFLFCSCPLCSSGRVLCLQAEGIQIVFLWRV